jgi:hypothetical protein
MGPFVCGLVDNPTLEVHPLKHQGTAGRIWPSVNLKIVIFARFGTMPIGTSFSRRNCLSQKMLGGVVGITDKTFRIATPMLKVFWTRRIAAGWRERHTANGSRERRASGRCEWARDFSGKSLRVRAARAPPRPFLVENTAKSVHRMCQLGGSVGLRHAGTRIVTEEPSPATAAVRTPRICRALIRHLVEWLIGRLR